LRFHHLLNASTHHRGAGFIGRHLVQRLVADASHEVIVLDNLRRAERRREKRFQFVEGDIRD